MVVPEGVPLKVLAKDPSVSWHWTNAATGKDLRVGRIDSRLSTKPSGWYQKGWTNGDESAAVLDRMLVV